MTNSKFSLSGVSNGKGWLKLTSSASGFGGTAAWAGDFNCDGRSGDIIVCANNGPCYVFFSGYFNNSVIVDTSILNGTNGCELVGPTNADFGGALALAGNITGNGCSSIMIAAYGISTVYVIFPMRYPPAIFNVSNVNASTGLIFVGIPDTALGAALAGEGDVDGDGELDIALTTSASVPSPSYVVLGKSNFTVLARFGTVNVTSPPAGASIIKIVGPLGLGSAISIEADLNKDGCSDIAIGVNGDINAVGIAFGSVNMPSMINVSMPNGVNVSLLTSSVSYFGGSIAAVGNVNGNGYQSLLIGSFGEEAFLLNGRSSFPANFDTSSFDGVTGVILTSAINGSYGLSGTRVGYTNSNGLNGFLVGTFSSNSTFFFDGREKWPATVDTSSLNCMTGIELDTNIDQAGCVLANIGDFNVDGVPDFIMGSCGTQNVAVIVFGQSFVTCTATRSSSRSNSRTGTSTLTHTQTEISQTTDRSPSGSRTATKSVLVTESATHMPSLSSALSRTLTSTARAIVSNTQAVTRTASHSMPKSASATHSTSGTKSTSPTNTFDRTVSQSRTVTVTPSVTDTAMRSLTATNSVTGQAPGSLTRSITHTPSHTQAATGTVSYSMLKSASETKSASSTNTFARTASRSDTVTVTPSITDTAMRSLTATDSVTSQAPRSLTRSITHTPSHTQAATGTVSYSMPKSASGTKSASPTNTLDRTASRSKTATVTPSITDTAMRSLTATDSVTNQAPRSLTLSITHTPSHTQAVTGTVSCSMPKSASPTNTFDRTVSRSKTVTFTPSVTDTAMRSLTATDSVTSQAPRSMTLSITHTPSNTQAVTRTVSYSMSKSASETKSASSKNTFARTASHSKTVTVTPSITDTAMRSLTATDSVTSQAPRSLTLSITHTPSHTQAVTRTVSYSMPKSASATHSTSSTKSASPTNTFDRTASRSDKVTITPSVTDTAMRSLTATDSVTSQAPRSLTRSMTHTQSHTSTITYDIESRTPSSNSSAAETRTASHMSTLSESQSHTTTSDVKHTQSITRHIAASLSHKHTPSMTLNTSSTASATATRGSSASAAPTKSLTATKPVTHTSMPTGTLSVTATAFVRATASHTPTNSAHYTSTVSKTGSCILDPALTVIKIRDVNGDGIPDVVVSFTNQYGVVDAYVVFTKLNVCLSFDINNPTGQKVISHTPTYIPSATPKPTLTKIPAHTATSSSTRTTSLEHTMSKTVSQTPSKSVAFTSTPSVTLTETRMRIAVPVPIYRPIIPLSPPIASKATSTGFPSLSGNLANLGNTTATGSTAGAAGSCQLDKSITITDVGDVNGDGISDDLLEVTQASGTVDVYVVFRTTNSCLNFDPTKLDGSNGFQIVGIPPGAPLSFTGADLNGDGKSDVIIGDSAASNGLGQVYCIYGDKSFPSVVDISALGSAGFTLTGSASTPGLGSNVAAVGDVNDDKVPDLSITNTGDANHPPQSTVVFGRNSTSSSASQGITSFPSSSTIDSISGSTGYRITGFPDTDASALKVIQIGDFNGNGIQDVAISDPIASVNGMSNAGRVCIVFGSDTSQGNTNINNLNGTNGFCINGKATGDLFGSSVSGVGDFSGDGIDDVIFGAPDASPNPNLPQAGAAYMLYGSELPMPATFDLNSLDGKNGAELDGLNAGDLTGTAVAGVGDVNADGYADAGVGAPGAQGNGLKGAGATYIWYGGPGVPAKVDPTDLVGKAGMVIQGTQIGQGLGSTLTTVGSGSSRDLVLGNADGSSNYVYGQNGTTSPASSGGSFIDIPTLIGILAGILPAICAGAYGVIVSFRTYKVKLIRDIRNGVDDAENAAMEARTAAQIAKTNAERAKRKAQDAVIQSTAAAEEIEDGAITRAARIEADTAQRESITAIAEAQTSLNAAKKAEIAANKACIELEVARAARDAAEAATKSNVIKAVFMHRRARRDVKHAVSGAKKAAEEAGKEAEVAKDAAGQVTMAHRDATIARRKVDQRPQGMVPMRDATRVRMPGARQRIDDDVQIFNEEMSVRIPGARQRIDDYSQMSDMDVSGILRAYEEGMGYSPVSSPAGSLRSTARGNPRPPVHSSSLYSTRPPVERRGIQDWFSRHPADGDFEGMPEDKRYVASFGGAPVTARRADGALKYLPGYGRSYDEPQYDEESGHGSSFSVHRKASGYVGYTVTNMERVLHLRFANSGVHVGKALIITADGVVKGLGSKFPSKSNGIIVKAIRYEVSAGMLHWAGIVAGGGRTVFLDSENLQMPQAVSTVLVQVLPDWPISQRQIPDQIYSDNCGSEFAENAFALVFGTRVDQEYAVCFHRNLGSGSPRLLPPEQNVGAVIVRSSLSDVEDEQETQYDLWELDEWYQTLYQINLALYRVNMIVRSADLAMDAREFCQCPSTETAKNVAVSGLHLYSLYKGFSQASLVANAISIGYSYYEADDHVTGIQAATVDTVILVGSMSLYVGLAAVCPPLAFGYRASMIALGAYHVASRIYDATQSSNDDFYPEAWGVTVLAGDAYNNTQG